MDKQRKKELKKEYLRQELLKQAESDDEILANFAKSKLGIPLNKLDSDKLRKLSDNDIEEKIFFKIEELFSIKQKTERINDTQIVINSLTKELQTFYYSYTLDSSLINGGFETYYLNSAGVDILETIDSAKRLEFQKLVDLLEKSLGLFLLIIESGFKDWLGEIDKWSEKSKLIDKEYFKIKAKGLDFEKLDTDYYKLDNDFRKIRIDYIRQNIDRFEI